MGRVDWRPDDRRAIVGGPFEADVPSSDPHTTSERHRAAPTVPNAGVVVGRTAPRDTPQGVAAPNPKGSCMAVAEVAGPTARPRREVYEPEFPGSGP